jgi:hypothetical protein
VPSNPSASAKVNPAEPVDGPLSTQGEHQAENKKGYLQVVHTARKEVYSARYYSRQERSAIFAFFGYSLTPFMLQLIRSSMSW